MKSWTVVATLAVGFFASHLALADDPTKQQCIDSDTQSQSFRSAGKLAQTREQLQICANAACPGIVRDDCAQRIDELNRAQPTVVFSAKSGAGKDLIQVQVTMDGQPFAETLDGRPLNLDPGDHVFTFEVRGEKKVTEHIVIRESEKGRHESVTIGKPPPPPPAGGGFVADDPNRGRTQRVLGLGIAGVGVVGVALGTIFGLSAKSSWSSAQSLCSATSCPSDTRTTADGDRTSAITKSTVSTISFIAGGVFLAGGAVLYFTAPKSRHLEVGLAPGLGGATLLGSF